jgi:biopolymer transport protein ExbB
MLTEQLKNFFDYVGVEWVMVLLLALGLIALIVIIERILFFRRHEVDIEVLARDLRRALESDDLEAAMRIALGHSGMEGRVIAQGIRSFDRGAYAVEEEIQGALSIERSSYDKYLPFLGTLGNNAPFIGLFGTVLGIISAFSDLEQLSHGANRAQAIMGSISEALVATAVGLLVAIPSVIAYNQFKGMIKERIERTGALSGVLLAHLKTPQKPKY